MLYDLARKRIWVAGHNGMVGSAVFRALKARGHEPLRVERGLLDLRNAEAVQNWMKENRPDVIVLAAAKVGGILANSSCPADFLYDNIMIQTNVIHSAYLFDVEKLLFLGSTCIYPKFAEQPIKEEALLTGPLELTNEPYAVAKISGIKLCQAYRKQHGLDFICALPTNLYGPNDNFELNSSHVLPALLRKVHEAKLAEAPTISVWGSGTPRREFMHVDDLADGLLFILENYSDALHLNVGVGEDITINELVDVISRVVGFKGRIVYDTSKPDGTPRKCSDNTRLRSLGWRPKIDLDSGIADVYRWFLANVAIANPTSARGL